MFSGVEQAAYFIAFSEQLRHLLKAYVVEAVAVVCSIIFRHQLMSV